MRDRRSGGRNLARLGGEDQAFVGTGFDNAVQFAWRRFRCIGFNNQPVATASHGLGACITDGPFRRGKKIWRRYRGSCWRSEEQTSELQSIMRNSYAVFCLKKKKKQEIE